MPTSMLKSGSKSFFFSCRRRHTMSTRDWSSVVCSSDLAICRPRQITSQVLSIHGESFDQSKPVHLEVICRGRQIAVKAQDRQIMNVRTDEPVAPGRRAEERRVGEEASTGYEASGYRMQR